MAIYNKEMLNLSIKKTMFVVLIIVLCLFAFQIVVFRNAAADDAYITYRYSFQLAQGNGFAFNAGEAPVEGTSSLLWALLHVIPGIAFDYLYISRAFSVIALGCFLLLYLWRMRLAIVDLKQGPIITLTLLGPLLALLVMPATGVHLNAGMEAMASGVLCTFAVVLVASGSYRWWMGFIASILFLTRPDAPLPFVIAILLHIVLNKVGFKQAIICISAPISSVLIVWAVKYAYFGIVFPLPFYAKATGTALLPGVGVVIQTVLTQYYWFFIPIIVGLILGTAQQRKRIIVILGAIIVPLMYLSRIIFVINYYDRFFWNLGIVLLLIYGCLEALIVILTNLEIKQTKHYLVISLISIGYPIWIGSSMITDLYWGRLSESNAFEQPSLEYAHGGVNKLLTDTAFEGDTQTALIWDAGLITMNSTWNFIDGQGLNTAYVALLKLPTDELAVEHFAQDLDVIVFNMSESDQTGKIEIGGTAGQESYDLAIENNFRHILSFDYHGNYDLAVFASPQFINKNINIIEQYANAGYQPMPQRGS